MDAVETQFFIIDGPCGAFRFGNTAHVDRQLAVGSIAINDFQKRSRLLFKQSPQFLACVFLRRRRVGGFYNNPLIQRLACQRDLAVAIVVQIFFNGGNGFINTVQPAFHPFTARLFGLVFHERFDFLTAVLQRFQAGCVFSPRTLRYLGVFGGKARQMPWIVTFIGFQTFQAGVDPFV